MPSKRYHITDNGTVHKGAAVDCSKCRALKKQKEKKAPKKKSSKKKRVCKVPSCENTLGPTNTSGYCQKCFLRSPAWKDTQTNSLVRVKDD